VNPADAPIMILALTSSALTRGQMYDAASTVLAQNVFVSYFLTPERVESYVATQRK
jgi:hypothetical protein